MYRHFITNEFNLEIEKEINRSKHLIQILSDEFSFLRSGKDLINSLKKNINVEFIIVTSTEKKSLKLVNLAKKIIDLDGLVYFINNKELYNSKDFFGLFDKCYIITKTKSNNSFSNEELFMQKNSFFESISNESNKLNLLSGDIDVSFKADKTVVKKNEKFKISWSVKNCHEIVINNGLGLVENKGSFLCSIESDTKYVLTAKNKDFKIKKSVYVKLYIEDDLKISVNVFDKTLKKFIEITPISAYSDHYAVFNNQKVLLSWEIRTDGKLIESNLGEFKLKDNYEFTIDNKQDFIFTYLSINNQKVKKLNFHGFDVKNKLKEINNYSFFINKYLKTIFKKLYYLISNK